MATLEITVKSGPESNRFDMVFYAFVAAHSDVVPDEALIKLETTPLGTLDRKNITMWNNRVVDQFGTYWRNLRSQANR